MATTTRDHAAAVRALRELVRRPEAAEVAERVLAGAEPLVLESALGADRGVLVLGPPGAARLAVLAAADERALRELLLALPRGQRFQLQVGDDWHLPAVAEVMDAGVKRGGGGGDGPLDRRDPLVALLRELAQPAGRERHGRFVAEGPTLVARAVSGGLPVEAVVHRAELARSPSGAALLERARAEDIACRRASDGLMGTLTPARPLPDVLAAVHLRLRDVSEWRPSAAATVLVAEHLQNPDNLGLVLRTADAAGVEAVVVAGPATDPLHRNCVRAARGAVGRLPIFRCAALPAWIAQLRGRGFVVAGATAHGDVGLHGAQLPPPVAVVVGNEEVGLSPETLAACTARLVIPMAPGQDSLNVGVAAGVVLFELARRRGS